MKSNIPIIVFILWIIPYSLFSCQCQKKNVTHRFVDDLKKYAFVGLVEVVKVDTVVQKSFNYGYTKVKILELFQGKYDKDEIDIVNAKGFECFVRLRSQKLGQKAIIKGFLNKRSQYEYKVDKNGIPVVDSVALKADVLVLDLCDENQLYVEKDTVIGNLTKDVQQRAYSFGGFIHKITFGLLTNEYYRIGGYSIEYQKTALKKTLGIIRRKTRKVKKKKCIE